MNNRIDHLNSIKDYPSNRWIHLFCLHRNNITVKVLQISLFFLVYRLCLQSQALIASVIGVYVVVRKLVHKPAILLFCFFVFLANACFQKDCLERRTVVISLQVYSGVSCESQLNEDVTFARVFDFSNKWPKSWPHQCFTSC